MTSGYYCAIFLFCGGGKKKEKRRQKTKAFYEWATTGISVTSPLGVMNSALCHIYYTLHAHWHHRHHHHHHHSGGHLCYRIIIIIIIKIINPYPSLTSLLTTYYYHRYRVVAQLLKKTL